MYNKKEYYENAYKPGEWRSGIKSSTLQVQIRDVEKRRKQGAYQEPYETTAAAVIELLDKADASYTALATEMMGLLQKHAELSVEKDLVQKHLDEAYEALKAAQEKIAALESQKHETVQSKVAENLSKGTTLDPATPNGRKSTKSK